MSDVNSHSTTNAPDDHSSHRPGVAHHVPWQVHRNAFVWVAGQPIAINFYPIATDLRAWLLRQGKLQVFPLQDHPNSEGFTNPYTASASILAVAYAATLGETHAFSSSESPLGDMEAEIDRMRLHHEQVLYTARFCEASLKQLLYCTAVPNSLYKKKALGQLLQQPCLHCRSHGRPKHMVSLLGTLAHRFHLCHEVDHCLDEHLKLANRRRNLEAAHATLKEFQPRPVSQVRAQMHVTSTSVAEELVHILQHISSIERALAADLLVGLRTGYGGEWWRRENLT